MQTMIDEAGKPAGPHRVYLRETNVPGLAVSRCFGDYVASAAGVTSIPDVVTMVLPTGRKQAGPHGHRGSGGHSSGRSGQGAARGRHAHPQQQQQRAAGSPQAQPGQGRGRSRSRRGGGRGRQAEAARGPQHGQRSAAAPPVPAAHATIGQDKHVLIVASDGLWEFVSNAEAVRIAARCAGGCCAAGLCCKPVRQPLAHAASPSKLQTASPLCRLLCLPPASRRRLLTCTPFCLAGLSLQVPQRPAGG